MKIVRVELLLVEVQSLALLRDAQAQLSLPAKCVLFVPDEVYGQTLMFSIFLRQAS
jgi:hypothetical protein